MKKVIIKCRKCGKKAEGDNMNFDELAQAEGWTKKEKHYICPECMKPEKKSKKEKPFVNYGQEDN